MKFHSLVLIALIFVTGCSDDDKKDNEQDRKSYSFSGSSTQKMASTSLSIPLLGVTNLTTSQYTANGLCTSVLCFTPTAITGKYYGAGLLIQSDGSGLSAYFGRESWSSVALGSASLDFDLNNPVSHSGLLICCGGEGDLTSENTYFSDVSYMFAYLDVTFEITASVGAHGDAVGIHTVRFVTAEDGMVGAKRGDLLVKDGGTFKWMDQDGTLNSVRPVSPVVMNDKVVNWTSSGESGNQNIPVMYAGLQELAGKTITSEDELKKSATYSFDFNVAGFVIFPDLLHADGSMIADRKYLLEKIHIHGLPYGNRGEMFLPKTNLTITDL